jgi:hypothetical protein
VGAHRRSNTFSILGGGLVIIWRAMWKDWGFAPSLFAQAKQFLDLAKHSDGSTQDGYIRASIVFSLMSFEAYWRDVITCYIQGNGATVDQSRLAKVKKEMARTDLKKALERWPQALVGTPLDTSAKVYDDFSNFREYRNFLVHGKISEPIRSSWGKLAQEIETVEYAALARITVSEMINMVAGHFGYSIPAWV